MEYEGMIKTMECIALYQKATEFNTNSRNYQIVPLNEKQFFEFLF